MIYSVKTYIYIDLGTVLIAVIVLLFTVILGSAIALETIISFFVGPLKYILFVLAIIILLAEAAVIIVSPDLNHYQKVIGGITNAVCSGVTVGISFLFLQCIFMGFLENMGEGHPIWAVFAILSDLFVFVLCFGGLILVRAIPYACMTERFPILFFSCTNYLLSAIFFCVVQGLIIGYYKGVVELIFNDWPEFVDFIYFPFGYILLEKIGIHI